MTEIWKCVKGCDVKTRVSNLGNVEQEKQGRQIKPYLRQKVNGYVYVALKMNGKRKEVRLHRLVADLFIPNPNGYTDVNHIDENKLNNSVDNLEWCSHSDNIKHSITKITKQSARARFLKRVNMIVRSDGRKFNTIAEASKASRVSRTTIQNCLNGQIRTAGGYGFKMLSRNEISGMKQQEINF